MPRRDRRSGVRFIEDGRDRSLTFFKRRSGLFKAASDLSTLTGARVAVVLESENGKFSSFGTPEVGPIVDAFLLGAAPTELDASEEKKARITNLQNEVFQLEKDKTMEDKRKKENKEQTKEIQATSKMAKYVYGNLEDLDAVELFEMYRELSRIKQEINGLLPTLLHEDKVEAGGRLRDPSLLQPTWWRSVPPQAVMPPKYTPWPPQASFQQHPWSSTSHPVLARPSSSFPNSVIFPSPHNIPQKSLQQHPTAPQAPSTVQLQAPKMPPSMAARPNTYHIRGIDINGNNSHPFSLFPKLSSPKSQPSSSSNTPPSYDSPLLSLSPQISSPLHVELPFNVQNYNSVPPPQHNASVGSTLIHPHQSFYNSSIPELNVGSAIVDQSGGQVGGERNGRFGLSNPQQSGFDVVMPSSSSAGESSGGGGGVGSNLGGINLPWY